MGFTKPGSAEITQPPSPREKGETMKRAVALLCAALLLLPPLALAQEKPEAALGRIASIGEISEELRTTR